MMILMTILMMVGAGTEDRAREARTLSVPPVGGGAYKFPGFGSRLGEGKGEGKQRCSNTLQDPWRGRRICPSGYSQPSILVYWHTDRPVREHIGTGIPVYRYTDILVYKYA